MANENQKSAVQVVEEKKPVVYQSNGQEVTLSRTIVRNYLTKGNGDVTDADLVQFISICQFNQLNPFLNEAYLVKFGTQPAQMIVSKEALMKRAEQSPNYDGIQAGIIVRRGDAVIELEGCYCDKNDVLVGGWAKVYRSDRKFPYVSKVNLEEYDKKQSIWNEKKSTMIAKVAKVQALREAFPALLGGMYTQEEQVIPVDEQIQEEKAVDANKEQIGFDAGSPSGDKTVEAVVDTKIGEVVKTDSKPRNPGF